MRYRARLGAALLFLPWIGIVSAQGVPGPEVPLPVDDSVVVLEYAQTHEMLGDAPLLDVRVESGGTVHVTIGRARADAGDYRLQIDRGEVADLLSAVVAAERLPTEASAAIDTQRRVERISDSTIMSVRLQVDGFQLADGREIETPSGVVLTERDVGADPSSERARAIGEVEQRLLGLVDRAKESGE